MYILPDMSDDLTATDFNNCSKQTSICVACGYHIYDKYIFSVTPGIEWHAKCLKCYECNLQLDETCTCYLRDGNIYCKYDYTRLFTQKCTHCKEIFNKNDFIMRTNSSAHVYHLECFRCSMCTKRLQSGDEFCVRDEQGLVCKKDIEQLLLIDEQSKSTHKLSSSQLIIISNNNNNTSCQNITNLQSKLINNIINKDDDSSNNENYTQISPKHVHSSNALLPLQTASNQSTQRTFTYNQQQQQHGHPHHHNHNHHHRKDKTTRVRTVLNEKQLHTLRACYGANPRPDALMKEQLVEMTGLSPRVIRVWFQNKRCKDKKKTILMKQIQEQQKNRQSIGHGYSMIATSPLQNDISNLNTQNQVDIQSTLNPYQQQQQQWLQNQAYNTSNHHYHTQNNANNNNNNNNGNMRIMYENQMMSFGSDEDDCFDNLSDHGDDSNISSSCGLDDNNSSTNTINTTTSTTTTTTTNTNTNTKFQHL